MKSVNLSNLQLYKNKISEHVKDSVEYSDAVDINSIFSKHHYIFKIRPFNTSEYAPYAYLTQVRMYTENNGQHTTLNKWISKSRTLCTATMKSTNTERDDIFDLKMSTNSVYTRTDSYQIWRSWLDGKDHWIAMPKSKLFFRI